ncbi:hypothetical protein [Paraburkholderia youngii]|uniref:hypothetical protein n=1 Tax=Paraburkholderia youngii TaxID=2782701 RepID=UPI001595CCE7|nr:hypothetical protein [Paraburkholderia youngii]
MPIEPVERLGKIRLERAAQATSEADIEVQRRSSSTLLVATAALRFLYHVTLKRGWSVDELPIARGRHEATRPKFGDIDSSTKSSRQTVEMDDIERVASIGICAAIRQPFAGLACAPHLMKSIVFLRNR